jgi:hypothetical protein
MVGRWRIEMAWQHRLPDGVRHEGSSSEGFTLSVSLPVDEDGLAPLQCPADAGHRFKVTLTQSPSGQSSNCYCPYCGTRAATDEFLADQLPRLDAAREAAAEQYAHQTLEDMLSKAFGKPTGPRSPVGAVRRDHQLPAGSSAAPPHAAHLRHRAHPANHAVQPVQ